MAIITDFEIQKRLSALENSNTGNSNKSLDIIKGKDVELALPLPYNFYNGSAVVYNNEIHILGSSDSSINTTKHYKYNGSSWTSVSTLPYYFYLGSAVVYNNEIHILGSNDASNTNKHNKYKDIISWTNITTSILNKISIPKDMIIQCSSYDTSKTNSSTLQSLGSNKYKALSDTIVYTKEDKVNITNHQ